MFACLSLCDSPPSLVIFFKSPTAIPNRKKTTRSDLTSGVRASARAVAAAETGVKDGSRAVKEQVLPAAVSKSLTLLSAMRFELRINKRHARCESTRSFLYTQSCTDAVESALKENAKLQHTAEVLSAAKGALQRSRFALQTLGVAGQAVTLAAAQRNMRAYYDEQQGQGQLQGQTAKTSVDAGVAGA